jgi:hypothetical protein
MYKNVRLSAAYDILSKALLFIFVIWAANLSYGFLHECGHAVITMALGGQVYDIYVNPLGTDAYTLHSYVTGASGEVILELAGMAVTTALGFVTLWSGYTPLPLFMALRTSIYALDYSPGTDISNVYQILGGGTMLISVAIVALNLTCAAIAIVGPARDMGVRLPDLGRITLGKLGFNSRP